MSSLSQNSSTTQAIQVPNTPHRDSVEENHDSLSQAPVADVPSVMSETDVWRKDMKERVKKAIDKALKIAPDDKYKQRKLQDSNGFDCVFAVLRRLAWLLSSDTEDAVIELEHLRTNNASASVLKFCLWVVEVYMFNWYAEKPRFIHRSGPFDINRHNTHGELEGTLNRSSMRALFKRIVEQFYAFEAEALPKKKIEITLRKDSKSGKKGQVIKKWVLNTKPIRPSPDHNSANNQNEKNGKKKSSAISNLRDRDVIYIDEDNTLKYVSSSDLEILYQCAKMYNMYVEGRGVAFGMQDMYDKIAECRKKHVDKNNTRGNTKLGSKINKPVSKDSKNNKTPSKVNKPVSKDSKNNKTPSKVNKPVSKDKNLNSRVKLSYSNTKDTVIIDGRPAVIKYKEQTVTDKDGFQKKSNVRTAFFQDVKGGTKIMYDNLKTNGKDKDKNNVKDAPDHVPEQPIQSPSVHDHVPEQPIQSPSVHDHVPEQPPHPPSVLSNWAAVVSANKHNVEE